jgi:short-subunit dehydrogenase
VTQDGDLERVVQAGVSTLGKIDIVVANAGFGVTGSIANLKLEDYRRQFETNVFGVLRTVYASLDELKKNRGSLVLLGSVAGYVSLPGSSPYSMSKFSIHALADAITPELKVHGVSVVLIAPGFVTSEIREVDNRGHYRPGRGEPLPAWLPMRTDRAARQLVEAVTRGRRGLKVRVITWHGKMVVWLQRYCPWVIAYAVNRGLRARKEPSISD